MKTNIMPIYMRELRSLFYSPIAWIVLFGFYVMAGYFWVLPVMSYAYYSAIYAARGGGEMKLVEYLIAPYIGNVAVIFVFAMPLATMRLLSEEKKSGTIEILFTWPFSDLDILLGKWLASVTLLAAMLLPSLINFVLIADKVSIPWLVVFTGLGGLFLWGVLALSVGLLASALTENQIIAAASAFAFLLFLIVLNWGEAQATGAVKELISQLSVMGHLQNLSKGLVNIKDVTYFVLFTVLMLFGALRVLESKKWR